MRKQPSKKFVRYMNKYLRKLQKVLRLTDWEIVFNPIPMDDEDNPSFAEIFVSKHRRYARVQIGQKFFEDPEGSLAHELIHCWTIRITQCVDQALEHKLTDQDVAAVIEVVDHPMEIATDELALAIRPLVPKWKGPRKI